VIGQQADDYHLVEGPPPIADYLTLRERSGLSPRRLEQAAQGLSGAWYAVHIRHRPSSTTVGMGRVLGDGGWYFHIIDMAVLPEHQRRGLGDRVLTALLRHIHQFAPPGAYVSLMADEPGRRLYARHGFLDTAPRSLGMARTLT
jgi:ribosomal protein S18 acetylase RimI-like enzyme